MASSSTCDPHTSKPDQPCLVRTIYQDLVFSKNDETERTNSRASHRTEGPRTERDLVRPLPGEQQRRPPHGTGGLSHESLHEKVL